MKTVNVYNSNYVHPVVILLNNNNHVVIDPKQTVQIETKSWFGYDEFRVDSDDAQNWKEYYAGRYNENLILRYVEEE